MSGAAWCSGCGRRGEVVAQSLDPDHPMVECRWYTKEGEPRGCGVRPGIQDSAELSEVMTERRRQAERKQHRTHNTRLVHSCRLCQELRSYGYA